MAKQLKAHLIFRASDQSLRVVRKRPALAWDELSFEVTLNVPDPWGRLAGAVVIDLPESGPPIIEVTPEEERE